MTQHFLVAPDGFVGAILDCVVELGVESARLEHFGKRVGHSRATMYRAYRGCTALMRQIHEYVLERLDGLLRPDRGDRQLAFDTWWTLGLEALRTTHGRAFRMLRPVVAVAEGSVEKLLRYEVRHLPQLVIWLMPGVPAPVAEASATVVWTALLNAAELVDDEAGVAALRRVAWAFASHTGEQPSAPSEPPPHA